MIDLKHYCTECVKDKKLTKKVVKVKDYYPNAIEIQYNKMLREEFLALDKAIYTLVVAELKKLPTHLDSERTDGVLDGLGGFFNRLIGKMKTPSGADKWYKKFSDDIHKWNTKKFVDGINKELGVDFYLPKSKVSEDILKEWVTQNSKVVERYGKDTIEKLKEEITRDYMLGLRATEIEKKIKKHFKPEIAKQKAKVWSRNEVGNLNTSLTNTRRRELNIELSEFITSGDERVRCEHRALDGIQYPTEEGITRKLLSKLGIPLTCSGSVSTKQSDGSFKMVHRNGNLGKEIDYYGGAIFAGSPINCRCTSTSVILLD